MPTTSATYSCHQELDKPLTKSDVAKLMSVCKKTIEQRVGEGKFPPPKYFGRTPYWHRKTVSEWLDKWLLDDDLTKNGEYAIQLTQSVGMKPSPKKMKSVPAVERMTVRNAQKIEKISRD